MRTRPSTASSPRCARQVLDDLPGPLHQGPFTTPRSYFTTPRSYPVIVRMANVLGEILDDGVTTQRGLSIKVLDVQGPMLPGREGETTQDFVPDTGTRFANAVLKAVGSDSTMLDFIGHPLVKADFSQAPIHYGDKSPSSASFPPCRRWSDGAASATA